MKLSDVSRRSLLTSAIVTALARAPVPARATQHDPWPELAGVGCVLFRHANAPGVGDPPGMRLSDCATQRNLDELGRSQARAIGVAFQARDIRIGRVLTSRWCRARETAEVAFPGMPIFEPAFDSFFDARHLRENVTARARRVILEWQGPGLLVAFTHMVNIVALTGISPRPAEGVVVAPTRSNLAVLGRITAASAGAEDVTLVRQ